MDERELDDVLRAAELHDIGKVAIPEGILHKPSALDAEEWAFMRRHTDDRRAHPVNAAPALRTSPSSSAPRTSAGTAAAIRMASPARRSRSARASSPSATPSTR